MGQLNTFMLVHNFWLVCKKHTQSFGKIYK
nr:MAG TPA: hypothetical protein [Caudoviricetes sp.]